MTHKYIVINVKMDNGQLNEKLAEPEKNMEYLRNAVATAKFTLYEDESAYALGIRMRGIAFLPGMTHLIVAYEPVDTRNAQIFGILHGPGIIAFDSPLILPLDIITKRKRTGDDLSPRHDKDKVARTSALQRTGLFQEYSTVARNTVNLTARAPRSS